MTSEPIEVTLIVIEALDTLGVRYVIGGSLASALHGVARTTMDADLVAELKPVHVRPLVQKLAGAFYVDEPAVREAVTSRRSFNVIHLATMFKVDVFIPKARPFDSAQLDHATAQLVQGKGRQNMRRTHLVIILILLALALPASPAHAGGVVTVCDEAHLLAALAGGGTVTFACSGTITLTAEITIAADTTIDGSGQAIIISGNGAVRVFSVNAGATLNLNRLTVANGAVSEYESGGGIAIRDGTLNVSNSTISGNRAWSGGGIYKAGGVATIANSTFSDNRAEEYVNTPGSGGGIFNDGGMLQVSASIFSENSAVGGGGGIDNGGTLTVDNSTFSGNAAISGRWTGAGGLGNRSGCTATVSHSTFSGNTASGYYGANGGGIYNDGAMTVSNSTFSGNSVSAEDVASGGGIVNGGTLTVINSTFSGNSATSEYSAAGGAIANGGTATLRNTVVANSPAGGNCYGAITDGGGNLSYPDTTCPGINRNPFLGSLLDNGGPTQTMALGPGSAAIDAGIDAICAAPPVNNLDQRGATRPAGPHCDIGSVEQQPYRKRWLPVMQVR